MKNAFLLSIFALSFTIPINAQWSNRYPKVEGYGHHVYLEGHELPVLNAGPTDPAPSPMGNEIVFSARGWLWRMDLNSDTATRITASADLDFSPRWSPDGRQIVFVRDNGEDMNLMLLDRASGTVRSLVATPAIDLDPSFSQDGQFVYYASAQNGTIDLWRIDLQTMERSAITREKGLERHPINGGKKAEVIYLSKKGFSYDGIVLLNTTDNTVTPLAEENFSSQVSFSLSPDRQTLAYTWPKEDQYELRLLDIYTPESNLLLSKSNGLPLKPAFSADGDWVYFVEYADDERSELKRVSVNGGSVEHLPINHWDWGTEIHSLTINSKLDGETAPVRMHITDRDGHSVIPDKGAVHTEGQHGMVFFYSPGTIEVKAPAGELTITAVHGFATKKTVKTVQLDASLSHTEIALERIWNAQENGWYSGDNHFHLNYGGTHRLEPEDILVDLRAEDLDIAFPLLANLGNRFLEQDLWKWKHQKDPIVEFGQEVRSHFLGHLGLIGTQEIFWPWVWGPGYDVYGRDDRLNATPISFTRKHGGLGGYVHPVSIRDPFTEKGARRVPVSLIADAVLGATDLIELGCLWTDEIGTAAVWHRLLNIGIPLGISAGSDVMNDLYRTMAVGADRVYVKTDGPLSVDRFLEGLKKGKSFVSNGPQLLVEVDGKEVGDVVQTDRKKVHFSLEVHSPVPYEQVEIFVNGKAVWTKKTSRYKESTTYRGAVKVPSGGWLTARVSGGKTQWPMMDSYPYAETSPVWFHKVGSVDPSAAREAASELLQVLEVSKTRLQQGYGQVPIPRLLAHFEKARQRLLSIISDGKVD